MLTLAALVAVLLAVPAAFMAGRFRKVLTTTAVCALVFSGAAATFLVVVPKDYLVKLPFLEPVLNPYLIAVYCFVAFIVATAVMLGVLIRSVGGWLVSTGSGDSASSQ